MFGRILNLIFLASILCACQSAPKIAPEFHPEQLTWHDQEFDYSPNLISVAQEDLFQLDPLLQASLLDPELQKLNTQRRFEHFFNLIFTSRRLAFQYAGGNSTTARETWANKRGDCISLTILAYSLGKLLDLPVVVQEVKVPVFFDRRGKVDFISGHVNLLIKSEQQLYLPHKRDTKGYIVIDFEPAMSSFQEGESLTEIAMLTRFYNNLAAEYLALGNNKMAYAYFKAAILADPSYVQSYSNLAQVYLSINQVASAEKMLRYALKIDPNSRPVVTGLYHVLQKQGREIEAQGFSKQLIAMQEKDPYYWLGRGISEYHSKDYYAALKSLETAQGMTRGFSELHVYLAIAYWRTNQAAKAREQMALLNKIDERHPSLAILDKKFRNKP